MSTARRSPERRMLVIGVGNRDRSDDAIGPAVVDEIRRREAPVTTIVSDGDLLDLMLEWRAEDDVVVVDCVRTGGSIGSVVLLDPRDLDRATSSSTHGLGVGFAVELAELLGRLPARLRVLGVVGRCFDPGPMSPELRGQVGEVTDEVLRLVFRHAEAVG